MKKRAILITAFCFFIIPIAFAQQQAFSANKGFSWLVEHGSEGNYANDIPTTAFAVMALKAAGQPDYADAGLEYIKSQEDTTKHCWPKDGCKVKDTAFALWVLKDFGEDTQPGVAWLQSSLTAALRENWFLEVVTTNNGTCRVSYTKTGSTSATQKDIAVNQGRFSCSGSFPNTFFNLNTCLENNLLNANPGIQMDVNCNDLGPSTMLSVIYNSGSSYYLIKEAANARDLITIKNGCFGTNAGGSCNIDTSLFSEWIMHGLGTDLSVSLWLKNNYDSLRAVDNAILYLVGDDTTKTTYLRNLKSLQKNDGSFNNQVFDTAVAALALKDAGSTTELDSATNWLKSKQTPEGSWENNVYKTALVLYSSFASASVTLPPIGTVRPSIAEPCGDGVCDSSLGENFRNCPEDCEERADECDRNGICETSVGENSQNCQSDCSCPDGVCDSAESTVSCPQDCREEQPSGEAVCGNQAVEGTEECDVSEDGIGDDSACPGRCIKPRETNECSCLPEEKGGFPWWIPIVIVIVLAGVIFFYLRSRKGPSRETAKPFDFSSFASKPESPPPRQYRTPQQPAKSKVEDELEKSLEEAKKLFKKI